MQRGKEIERAGTEKRASHTAYCCCWSGAPFPLIPRDIDMPS